MLGFGGTKIFSFASGPRIRRNAIPPTKPLLPDSVFASHFLSGRRGFRLPTPVESTGTLSQIGVQNEKLSDFRFCYRSRAAGFGGGFCTNLQCLRGFLAGIES